MRGVHFQLVLGVGASLLMLGRATWVSAATVDKASMSASATNDNSELPDVIVTARRITENLQEVPVAVTVLTQATFDAKGTYSPLDLQTAVPGLAVEATTSDRNNITFTIRGQGNTYGTLFPAVITYFAEVPTTQLGTGQFFDLDQVEVLRGPQGVQFGRVTDGGNVMVAPKRPTNNFDGELVAKAGDYGFWGGSGFVNLPVINDKVMLRIAFDVARRNGFTTNVYNGEKLDSVNYDSGRIGLLIRPNDQFENYLVAQYERTDDTGTSTELDGLNPVAAANSLNSVFPLFNSAGNVYGLNSVGDVVPFQPGLTPVTTANYIANLQANVARQQSLGVRQLFQTSASYDKRDNLFLVNTTSFIVSPLLTFKNILGFTNVRDDQSSNYVGGTGSYVGTCHTSCASNTSGLPFNSQEQLSEEFRMNGRFLEDMLNWSAGTYWDLQQPRQRFENYDIALGVLQRDNVQNTYTRSKAGYAYAEYDFAKFVPGLKFNGGVRYTADSVDSRVQAYIAPLPSPLLIPELTPILGPALAAATANAVIPHGLCQDFNAGIFSSQCKIVQAKFNVVTYTAGLSYQIAPKDLVYVKVSHGYRPGGANPSAPATLSPEYQPEYDLSVEGGLKSDWDLGGIPARTNIAIYHDNYSNIQESVAIVSNGVIDSIIANVAKATIQGIELEGTIIPVPHLTLGVNYSYTDAKFDKDVPTDPTACSRTASANIGFCPLNMLPNTPKDQVSILGHYDFINSDAIGTVGAGFDFYYKSAAAISGGAGSYISPPGVQAGYGVLNLNANWQDVLRQPIDLAFFMTNVTDRLYRVSINSNLQNSSIGNQTDTWAAPRMFGFTVKYRFGANAH